jgi:hypothetical protein
VSFEFLVSGKAASSKRGANNYCKILVPIVTIPVTVFRYSRGAHLESAARFNAQV